MPHASSLTPQAFPPKLPPELSACEAALASLEPSVTPGSRDAAKSAALLRLLESPPPLTGEKLIETIVRSDDQEITLSLKEYVKSARFTAGTYGVILGLLGGLTLGVLIGCGLSAMLFRPLQNVPSVREVHHVPYFVNDPSHFPDKALHDTLTPQKGGSHVQ